jgi:hypothetical protein
LCCDRAGGGRALGAGAGTVFFAILFVIFLIVEAGKKARISREFSAGFRGGECRNVSQSHVWTHVQNSSGVGFAD